MADLSTARTVYEALGFRINEHSSDDRTASVVVDENIVVTLQTTSASPSSSAPRQATPHARPRSPA